MVIIKRYPNRKLYDSEAKKYITLEGIAELIRTGQEVQIVDHSTGEDLTAVTLTQIIFEQEKKTGGFLPRSVLTGLVQAGGDTLGNLRRTLASPLDLLRHVDDEIEKRIQALIKRGDLPEQEGHTLLSKLINSRTTTPSTAEIEDVLNKRGVPTQKDIQKLSAQLDSLTAALENLKIPTESESE
ncbi:MAG: pesticidal protein Cry15Aa [Ardenticatenaceae bacterium]|nr:pesticidal protein Cry15Aa [Ardenticatenaceae bacterium]